MKQFLKQLRILLWKNFTLRRRQIFRNVIEFLWPLAIFIILVSVRHKKPAENVPEEKRPIYFAPRALPSAGGLMFIQSFFCNYQVNEFHPEPQNLPTFTNSMFTKIIEDMYPLLQNQSQIENLMKLSTDLPQLLNDSMLLLNDLRKSVLPTSVLFGNTSVAWMISNLNITTQTAEAMTRSSIQVQSIMDLFEDASSFTISRNITAMQKQIEEKLCNGSSFSKILSLPEWADEAAVQSEMCSKINQKTLEKIALHVVSRRQEIEKNLPEVGNIVNLIEELFERYENVQSEIQNIPQFDQLIDKLVELISNVSKDISTGNMTNTEFLQFFVCGRNRNYKPSYMQQTSRQMFPNTTEEKIGKIPSEGEKVSFNLTITLRS